MANRVRETSPARVLLEEYLRALRLPDGRRLPFATCLRQSQGYVVPESWTHGSSEQRMRWLREGLQSTDIRSACDTFER